MTTENKEIDKVEQDEIDEAWERLWEFAINGISWSDYSIDHDSFIEAGKEKFQIKIKELEKE